MIKKMEKAKVDRLFSWILATQNFNYTQIQEEKPDLEERI